MDIHIFLKNEILFGFHFMISELNCSRNIQIYRKDIFILQNHHLFSHNFFV